MAQLFSKPPPGMMFAKMRKPSSASTDVYKSGLDAYTSGDKAKALSLFQKAQQMDPMNQNARMGVQRIQEMSFPGPVSPKPSPVSIPPTNPQGNPLAVVPGVPPAPIPQVDPSHAAYRTGLEAYLAGNEDAALHAWSLSKEPEAKIGIQRIMQKRTPPPTISPQSMGAYRDGLLSFLDGNVEGAKKAWGAAIQMDPNNRAAHRGLQRLAQSQGQVILPSK